MASDLRRCSSVACPSSQKVRSSSAVASSPGAAHDLGVIEIGVSVYGGGQVVDRHCTRMDVALSRSHSLSVPARRATSTDRRIGEMISIRII